MATAQHQKFVAIVRRDDESGKFVAEIPALPGALTEARTLEELRENLREVVALYLDDLDKFENEVTSKFVGFEEIEIVRG
ncbi:type II toxin-antitoxin system HicB family antitoxin [bacterium]|nr:type II toxin-antitoxin system HicB family antitoxin [bacterium]